MCAKVCHAWKYVWEHVMTEKVCKDVPWLKMDKDMLRLEMCARMCCHWGCVWGHAVNGNVCEDMSWLEMCTRMCYDWGCEDMLWLEMCTRMCYDGGCEDMPWLGMCARTGREQRRLSQQLSTASSSSSLSVAPQDDSSILWEGLGNRWPTGYSSLLFATHLLVVYLCVDHYLIQKETSLMWTESFTHLRVRRLLLMEV